MKNRTPYTIEELMDNREFMAFVKDELSVSLMEKWKTYESENELVVDEARQLLIAFSGADREVNEQDIIEVRNNLQELTSSSKKLTRLIVPKYAIAIAASLTGLLCFVFWPRMEMTHFKTALAEQESIELPDKSTAILNASSTLSFDKKSYNQSNRILQLEGQAFIDVVKGKPFIVKTEFGEVEVLGTSFDVYARGTDFNVACKTGRVKVTASDGRSTILLPGEEVFMSENKMNKIKKSLDKIGSWSKGTFYFEKINLRHILDEVERQFNTKIICTPTGIGDQLYSGYFINTHLDSALMSICWPLRIQYEHQGNNVIISRNE